LLLRLVDEVISFLDFAAEVLIRAHVLLDLLNWELDKHTGDLWNSIVADELLDEWEDGFTNSFFQVWVSLRDGWDQLGGNLQVLSGHWVLRLHSSSWHWGLWWCHHVWHWGLWHSLLLWNWHTVGHLWHWLSHLLLSSHWHVLSSHSWLLRSVVIWLSWSSVVVLVWSSSLLSGTHGSLRVVEVSIHLLVLLHDVQQLLKDLSHVWVAGKVIEVEGTSLLSLILLEIGLIDGVFDLDLSLLLDLIMVDHEGLTVIGGVVKGRLGNGS